MSTSGRPCRDIAIEQTQSALSVTQSLREPHLPLSASLALAQAYALIYIGDAINDLIDQRGGTAR